MKNPSFATCLLFLLFLINSVKAEDIFFNVVGIPQESQKRFKVTRIGPNIILKDAVTKRVLWKEKLGSSSRGYDFELSISPDQKRGILKLIYNRKIVHLYWLYLDDKATADANEINRDAWQDLIVKTIGMKTDVPNLIGLDFLRWESTSTCCLVWDVLYGADHERENNVGVIRITINNQGLQPELTAGKSRLYMTFEEYIKINEDNHAWTK